MKEAVQIVESLSDVQAILLIKELYRKIYKGISYSEMVKHLPSQEASIQTLMNTDNQAKKNKLPPKESVQLTHRMLLAFARDEQIALLLIDAWNEIKEDDDLLIETIVALGILVNLTLFLASSDIKYEEGKFSFHKEKTSPETLKQIIEPVNEIIRKKPNISF